MNHLVFLDAQAGELEKILSGVKTVLLKESDPAHPAAHLVRPGDSLYFLRDQDDCAVRVRATVVRVMDCTDSLATDLSLILKEMQPRLQLTEDQYASWSARKEVVLVEFGSARKTAAIRVAPDKVTDRSDWHAFEDISQIA